MKTLDFKFEHLMKHTKGEQLPTYAEWRKGFTAEHYGFSADYGSLEVGVAAPLYRFKAKCQACGHTVEYHSWDEDTTIECPYAGLSLFNPEAKK